MKYHWISIFVLAYIFLCFIYVSNLNKEVCPTTQPSTPCKDYVDVSKNDVSVNTDLCWMCSNATIEKDEKTLHYVFDLIQDVGILQLFSCNIELIKNFNDFSIQRTYIDEVCWRNVGGDTIYRRLGRGTSKQEIVDSVIIDAAEWDLQKMFETRDFSNVQHKIMIINNDLTTPISKKQKQTILPILDAFVKRNSNWIIYDEPLLDITSQKYFILKVVQAPLYKEISEKLNQLTNIDPNSCQNQNYIVHPLMASGFGSIVTRVGKLLATAMVTNRQLVLLDLTNKFSYGDASIPSPCKRHDLSCYFLRDSVCSSYILERYTLEDLRKFPATSEEKDQIWFAEFGDHYNAVVTWNADTLKFPWPKGEHSLVVSTYFYENFLLTDLKWEIRQKALQKIEELNLPKHFVAIHIRRGDKWKEIGEFQPLSWWLDSIEIFAKISGIRAVFVATDSIDIIQELGNYSYFDFYYDKNQYRTTGKLNNFKTDTGENMMISAMADFIAAKRSVYFLGTPHSGFSEIIEHSLFVESTLQNPAHYRLKSLK